MSDYNYKITEGGTYTVKAIRSELSKESNEVEVAEMTVTITEAAYHVYAPNTVSVDVNIHIDNPITGELRIYPWTTASSDYTALSILSSQNDYIISLGPHYIKSYMSTLAIFENPESSTPLYSYANINASPEVIIKDTGNKILAKKEKEKAHVQLQMSYTNYSNEVTFTPSGMNLDTCMGYTIHTPNADSDETILSAGMLGTTITKIYNQEGRITVEIGGGNPIIDLTLGEVPTIKLLDAPILTYNAAGGQLEWDEVNGAESYEVYKDGVKIADVPKKS